MAGDTAPSYTGQSLLCLINSAFAVLLHWHFPLAVWAKHNICHQLFVIQLILPFPLHWSWPTLHWHLSHAQIYHPCHSTPNCQDIWTSLSLASQGSGFKYTSREVCCSCSWASHKESWQSPVFRSMILHLWLIFTTSPDLEQELDALWSLPAQWLFLLPLLSQLPGTDLCDQFEGCWLKPVLQCLLPTLKQCLTAGHVELTSMGRLLEAARMSPRSSWNLLPESCPQEPTVWTKSVDIGHPVLEGSHRDVLLAAMWACPSRRGLVLATHPKRAPLLDKE